MIKLLDMVLSRPSIAKIVNCNRDHIVIDCFLEYLLVEESSASVLCSIMKGPKRCTIKSHTVTVHGMKGLC